MTISINSTLERLPHLVDKYMGRYVTTDPKPSVHTMGNRVIGLFLREDGVVELLVRDRHDSARILFLIPSEVSVLTDKELS